MSNNDRKSYEAIDTKVWIDTDANKERVINELDHINNIKEIDKIEISKVLDFRNLTERSNKHKLDMKDPKKRKQIEFVNKIVSDAIDKTEIFPNSKAIINKRSKSKEEIGKIIDDSNIKNKDKVKKLLDDACVIDAIPSDYLTAMPDATCFESYGALTFALWGGLNGVGYLNNRWTEYLNALQKLLILVHSNDDVNGVYLMSIDVDCADDVFYAYFGIQLKRNVSE